MRDKLLGKHSQSWEQQQPVADSRTDYRAQSASHSFLGMLIAFQLAIFELVMGKIMLTVRTFPFFLHRNGVGMGCELPWGNRLMHRNYLDTLPVICLAALSLAACMPKVEKSVNASNPVVPSTPSVPISGTVADGYIFGASVFLDKNDNGVLDSGDPSATTDPSGKFSISDSSETDLANHRLIAIVPTIAKDADFDGFVQNAYYLSYPRGGPRSPFISPFSTLIDMKMKLSGLTKEEAFAAVSAGLGIQMPVDAKADDVLNADFIKAATVWGTGITPIAEKMTRISRVLVNGMGKALDQARTTMNIGADTATLPSPANEAQRFKLVSANILDNLDLVVASASTLEPPSATSAPPRTKALVQADVSSKGDNLKSTFLQNLGTQTMVEAQVIQALEPSVSSMSLDDLPDDIYALRGRSSASYDLAQLLTVNSGGNPPPAPGEVQNSSGDTITIGSIDPRTKGAAATTAPSYLSTDATAVWLVTSALFASPYIEGATLTTATTGGEITIAGGARFKLNISKYNIAGKSMNYILAKNNLTATNGFSVSGVFPAGSEAFRLVFVARDDIYYLPPNSVKTAQTSIDSFIASYPSTGTSFFSPGTGKLGLRFAGSTGADNGIIKFRNLATGSDLATDGLWKKETLRGKTILRLSSIPDNYRVESVGLTSYQEPFVALDNDGKATFGLMLRKGTDLNFAGYLFNKTAMNAINAANGLARLP